MEKAIWKGKEIFAFEISKDYDEEKCIRKASSNKELLCPDENCKNRELKYCHGEKKAPYFAHRNNTDCRYEKYDNETTEYVKTIKRNLYSHFRNKGYDVKMDVKLVEKHYSHLVITEKDIPFPIEIITKFSGPNRIDSIKKKYDDKQLSVNWILTDLYPNNNDYIIESELNFAKRFSLNETDNHSLITIDLDGENVIQYCMDTNRYIFNGFELQSNNYPKIFRRSSNINSLEFDNGKLQIGGFFNAFNEFIDKKKCAFNKRIIEIEAQIKEEEKRREERKIHEERQKQVAEINKIIKKNETKLKDEKKSFYKVEDCSLEKIQLGIKTVKLKPYQPGYKDEMKK